MIFHPNLEYGSPSKPSFGSYIDLNMDHHQNLEYGSQSRFKVWIMIKI